MSHHDKLTLSIEESSDSFVVSLVEEDGEQEDEDVSALASQLSGLGSDCSENPESDPHSSFLISLAVVEEKLDSSGDSFNEFCDEVTKKNCSVETSVPLPNVSLGTIAGVGQAELVEDENDVDPNFDDDGGGGGGGGAGEGGGGRGVGGGLALCQFLLCA